MRDWKFSQETKRKQNLFTNGERKEEIFSRPLRTIVIPIKENDLITFKMTPNEIETATVFVTHLQNKRFSNNV